MGILLTTPNDAQAKADLDLILPTLSAPELLACRAALRARTLDCRSNRHCFMAAVAREREIGYWELSEVDTQRPFELWAAAYILPDTWTEHHQLLDQWLTVALDALTLESPRGRQMTEIAAP